MLFSEWTFTEDDMKVIIKAQERLPALWIDKQEISDQSTCCTMHYMLH